MRIPVFYGMLLLVLLLIYILEARSVALKQGETAKNEKIVVCLLSLAIAAFFLDQLEYWNVTQSVACGF